jgi:hypothetical protein
MNWTRSLEGVNGRIRRPRFLLRFPCATSHVTRCKRTELLPLLTSRRRRRDDDEDAECRPSTDIWIAQAVTTCYGSVVVLEFEQTLKLSIHHYHGSEITTNFLEQDPIGTVLLASSHSMPLLDCPSIYGRSTATFPYPHGGDIVHPCR